MSRKLRIAVSVFFGLLTVTLWVWSYWDGNAVAILAHHETKLSVIPKPGSIPQISFRDDYPFDADTVGSVVVGRREEATI